MLDYNVKIETRRSMRERAWSRARAIIAIMGARRADRVAVANAIGDFARAHGYMPGSERDRAAAHARRAAANSPW